LYRSTSSGAQDVTLQEYFQIQVLVTYLPFSNPAHKTETRIAIRQKTADSNPPGPIKLSSQSETGRNE
jgi:hypothetical protein